MSDDLEPGVYAVTQMERWESERGERENVTAEILRALRSEFTTDELAWLYELARRDLAAGFEGDHDFQPEPIALAVIAKLAKMRPPAPNPEEPF